MKPAAPAAASWQSTLRWVMTTPFGFPVVPEVYSTVTGSSGLIAATRPATAPGVAASRCLPSAEKSAQVRY